MADKDKQTELVQIADIDFKPVLLKNSDKVNDVCVDPTEEYSMSDEAIMLDTELMDNALREALQRRSTGSSSANAGLVALTQDLIKYESISFTCTRCFEDFPNEHEYDEHQSKHLQNFDGDVKCGTSKSHQPRTAESSCCDSSYMPETKEAVLMLIDDPSLSTESAHGLVNPVTARLATNILNKMYVTEDSDDNQKNIQILDNNNVKLANQLFDGCNRKNNNNNGPNNNCGLNLHYDDFKNSKESVQYNSLTKTQGVKSSFQIFINSSKDCNNQERKRNKISMTKKEKPASNNEKNNKLNAFKTSQTDMNNVKDIHSSVSVSFIKNEMFSCDVCKKIFFRKSILVEHVKVHTEVKLSCKFCQYKCRFKSTLTTHVRIHTGEKLYSCKFCEYKCVISTDLVRHIRTHTSEMPYSCELCDYRSVQNNTLLKHMRTHSGEKPYSCQLCDYKSVSNSNLSSHMIVHSGVKGISCGLCSFKCARNFHLTRHMRTHTGEKPFSCKLCDSKFTRKSNLVSHMRIHTGEKPYSCKSCTYKCSERRSLVKHMKSHTGG